MNCQHCQAPLASKRAKQCPDCASIKNDAYKRATYGATMEAFDKAAKSGLTGQAMRDFVLGKKSEAAQANHVEMLENEARRKARASRTFVPQDRCPDCGGPADRCGGGNCTSGR